MVIFNSYVSLPEGTLIIINQPGFRSRSFASWLHHLPVPRLFASILLRSFLHTWRDGGSDMIRWGCTDEDGAWYHWIGAKGKLFHRKPRNFSDLLGKRPFFSLFYFSGKLGKLPWKLRLRCSLKYPVIGESLEKCGPFADSCPLLIMIPGHYNLLRIIEYE